MKKPILLPLVLATCSAAPCLKPDTSCSEKLPVGDGHAVVFRTHALGAGVAKGVKLAYIMVHGTNRNADEYFAWTLASTAAAGRLDSTVVAAPHFKARARQGTGDPVAAGELYWTNEGWKAGEAALNGTAFSYDVMDRMVEAFDNRERFPDLEEIVVAGHSAGGQYVQRYAASNQVDGKLRAKIRYVVANPSSYVYMNELRLRSGATCSEKGGCTGPFVQYWDAANCTAYNHYRYGLDKLTGYSARTGAESIRQQFLKRRVVYLVGELDTKLDDPDLDKTCPAQAEGPNRRERGVNFWNYMKEQFQAGHKLGIAGGCGHAAVCVFAGTAGVRAVFGPYE